MFKYSVNIMGDWDCSDGYTSYMPMHTKLEFMKAYVFPKIQTCVHILSNLPNFLRLLLVPNGFAVWYKLAQWNRSISFFLN